MTLIHCTKTRLIQVANIVRPSQYERVVRDKETAKQDIEVAKRERPRIITQAQTKKKEAETQAEITLREANVQVEGHLFSGLILYVWIFAGLKTSIHPNLSYKINLIF